MIELKPKQLEILEVAVQLFKEKGYVGTSVRDIASQLDIKAASLYSHIRSKEEVLEWICFGMAQDFFTALHAVKKEHLSGKDRLYLFIKKHLEVVLKNPDVTNIYSNEWKHLDGRLTEFIELRRKYQREVEELIEEIYHEEKWNLNSPRFTSRFILHTLNNSYFWIKQDAASSDQIIDQISEKLLFGLIGKK